eukprot:EG_transcript_21842
MPWYTIRVHALESPRFEGQGKSFVDAEMKGSQLIAELRANSNVIQFAQTSLGYSKDEIQKMKLFCFTSLPNSKAQTLIELGWDNPRQDGSRCTIKDLAAADKLNLFISPGHVETPPKAVETPDPKGCQQPWAPIKSWDESELSHIEEMEPQASSDRWLASGTPGGSQKKKRKSMHH